MKQARTIARDVIGERWLAALEVRGLRVVHADTKIGKVTEQIDAAVAAEREACFSVVTLADTLSEARDKIRARRT